MMNKMKYYNKNEIIIKNILLKININSLNICIILTKISKNLNKINLKKIHKNKSMIFFLLKKVQTLKIRKYNNNLMKNSMKKE